MSRTRQYAKGRHAVAECQRSGQKMYYRDLVEDGHISGLLVHPDWWEPKHPQEIPVRLDDPVALWRPAPELSKPPGEGDDPTTGCCNLDPGYTANTTTSGAVEQGQTLVGINDALRFDIAQGAVSFVYIQMDNNDWWCSPISVPIQCTPTYSIPLAYPFDGPSPISAGAKVVAGNNSTFALAAAAVPASLDELVGQGNESTAIALNATGGIPPYLYQWSWVVQPDPLITITSPTAQSTTLTVDAGLALGTYTGTLRGNVVDTCAGDKQQSVNVDIPISIEVGVAYPTILSVMSESTGDTWPTAVIGETDITTWNAVEMASSGSALDPYGGFATVWDYGNSVWIAAGSNPSSSAPKVLRSSSPTGAVDTWTDISSNLQNTASPDYFLAGAGDSTAVVICGANAHIERSTDGGTTWANVTLPGVAGAFSLTSVTIDPTTGYWYCSQYSTGYTVWESQNNGATWSVYGTGTGLSNGAYGILVNGSTAIAATFGGIYRSTNGGDNWTQEYGAIYSFKNLATNGSGTWVCTEYLGGGRLYSTDDGDSWNVVNAPGGGSNWFTGLQWSAETGFLAILKQGSNQPALSSSANGISWTSRTITGNNTFADEQPDLWIK